DQQATIKIDYGSIVENAIAKIVNLLPDLPHKKRWLAIQYLEGNEIIQSYVRENMDDEKLQDIIEETEKKIKELENINVHQKIYKERNHHIESILDTCLIVDKNRDKPLTEKIDAIVTHRFLGIPIFLALMYLMFMLTFN